MDVDPENCLVAHRRQAVPVLHRARVLRPRRRGDLPRPRLPDLRVGDPLGRRRSGAAASCARRTSFSLDPERLAALLSPRTKLVILNYPQNPTGGASTAPTVAAVADGPRDVDGLGARRRGLLAAAVRRAVLERRRARLDARAHGRPRRALEDLRDDRLALRLRRGARRRWSSRSPASSSTRPRACRRSCSSAGHRRARRAAGRRRRDGRGVPCAGAGSSSTAWTRSPALAASSRRARSTRSRTSRGAALGRRPGRPPARGGGRRHARRHRPSARYGDGHLRISYANSEANLREALATDGRVPRRSLARPRARRACAARGRLRRGRARCRRSPTGRR